MGTVGSKVFLPMGRRLQYKLIRQFWIEGSNAVLYRQAPQWPVPFAQWHLHFLYMNVTFVKLYIDLLPVLRHKLGSDSTLVRIILESGSV